MSYPSLNSLVIENLRGSITPFKMAFEKGKRLTIIYGENGTGKSTISDALDLMGNGNVGSLDSRGIGQTKKYWPSIGKKAQDIKVTLGTSAGNCIATIGSGEVVISDTNLCPEVAVLRRRQILSLIEAKPADRYAEISRFVDVSGLESSEASLRQLILEKERTYETATTRVSENISAIEKIWVQAGSPGVVAIDWAKEETRKDQTKLESRKLAIDRLVSQWNSIAQYPKQIQEQNANINEAEKALRVARAEQVKLVDTIASDCLDVLEILSAAKTHFEKHPHPDVCPLCGSSEKAKTLVDDVNKRIQSQAQYGKLQAAMDLVKTREAAVQKAKQRLEDITTAATKEAAKLETLSKSVDVPVDLVPLEFPIPSDFSQWPGWLASQQAKCEEWQIESDACIAKKTMIKTLKDALAQHESNEKDARRLEAILPRLRNMKALVEVERKRFTDCALSSIASNVGVLYEMIHPGEGLNKISLALDPSKRASLEIAAEFGSVHDTPPQAYFSDSHLDTLGLCVFLALAEKECPESKILVLDDVLGSVDEPHVDRIIEMIYEASEKFRYCIVTTHYGPWRHKYRWGWLKNGHCQFIELRTWSIHSGISHSRGIPEIDRLRALLTTESPDLQAICSKSGVILEAILDFLTQLYECNTPRRLGGSYTLGDLLPAIDGKLKRALRVEHVAKNSDGQEYCIEIALEPHLTELARIQQVRNVTGCHFNEITFELLDSDALAFGTEVLKLADALIDSEAGWPRNDKSGSYWATAGETRRLYPLRRPS